VQSLGSLNPELYKSCGEEGDHLEFPDRHIGRLWFSLSHNKDTEKLTVTLIKIRNLPPRQNGSNNQSMSLDPFVKIFLTPDERNPLQSKMKRKTSNPRFDESFVFSAAKSTLEERVLRFIVYDMDQFKRQTVIGYANYALKDYVATKQQRLITWIDLQKEETEASKSSGEVYCSLAYNLALEQLTVSVIEAKHLPFTDPKHCADSYAKVTCCLLGAKPEKAKKTKMARKCTSPVFNESFMFKFPRDRLNSTSVTIQIMQTKPEKQLGRICLGGQLLSKGKALEHWQKMIDCPKDVFQDWHYLSD